MDLKDNEKSSKYRKHQHITSRYYESNAGHLFVNNVNPFNSVGGQAGDVKENGINKRKNERYGYYKNRSNNESGTSPSKELVNEILQNYPFNENNMLNDQYEEIHEAFLSGQQRTFSQPMVGMSANVFGTEFTCCSRDVTKTAPYDPKVTYGEYDHQNNRHIAFSNDEMVTEPAANENGRCEKTTYCRPLLNMYNQEFIYKTMQRNARLQKLVKKLVVAREREKRREAWNNYINDLKNKHRYYSNEPSTISPQYVPGDCNAPAMIDDYYNARSNWPQSNPCQHLLDDLYGAHNYTTPHMYGGYPYDYDSIVPDARAFGYDNNRFCYPTSSQANILRWNRERLSNGYAYDLRPRPTGRYYRGNTIVVEKEHKSLYEDKLQGTNRPYPIYPPIPQSPKIKTPLLQSPGPRSPIPQTTPEMTKSQSPTTPLPTDKPLPLVNQEDQELNVIKPETSQDGTEIYFPYTKEAETTEKDSNEAPRFLERGMQGYLKQKSSKQQTNTNSPHKQALSVPLKFDKDDNASKKLDEFKNKMVAKVRNKQKESTNDNENDELQKIESFKEKFKRVSNNITKLKEKIQQSDEDTKLRTLANIEEKIDALMKSINSIKIDIKTKKNLLLSKKSTAVSCCTTIVTSRNNLNRPRSDPYGLVKNEEYLCGVVQSSSRTLALSEVGPSDLRKHRHASTSRMDKILLEEMKKSDKVKRDIEELLNIRNERNCSVQITFDIPTRERSTEVTDSLSKARLEPVSTTIIEEIPRGGTMGQGHRQMTIAVNTDPLGLLALLRVSTEAVKQLLSFVPNLNYNTYLSMLPLPTPQCVSHYICNICGAAFGRPSLLSDHIEQHNLGRTRDCCVCRHTLDMRRAPAGLFSCRYCGQRFTRAYCCELHQRTCARRLGMPQEVTSGHMLLR